MTTNIKSMNDNMQNNNSILDKKKSKYTYSKQPIGKGSFSTVYKAVDDSGKTYALKCIDASRLEKHRIDKLYSELKISSQLNHKNIVKCYETFTTKDKWYIVNEYCDYGTFRNLINSLKEVSELNKREELAFYYLIQLRNALYYLHKKNIIHRDLKPENILMTKIDDDIIVKLADFGFSRYFQNNSDTSGYDDLIGTICGSPLYMAPELLVDMRYNIKADLWSFGIIMYEMIYGKNPYPIGINQMQLIEYVKNKKIKYDCIFSDTCMDLIKSLLCHDPKDRINWDDFFNHKWFKSHTIDISIDEFKEEISSTKTQPIDIPKPSKKTKNSGEINFIDNYILSSNNSYGTDKNNEDYVFVDITEKNDVKSYRESIGSSLIRIVSKSIDFFTTKSF